MSVKRTSPREAGAAAAVLEVDLLNGEGGDVEEHHVLHHPGQDARLKRRAMGDGLRARALVGPMAAREPTEQVAHCGYPSGAAREDDPGRGPRA